MDQSTAALVDFLPPELATRLRAVDPDTADVHDLYALVDEALFEAGRFYAVAVKGEKEEPGKYTELLALTREGILLGVLAWVSARSALGPLDSQVRRS